MNSPAAPASSHTFPCSEENVLLASLKATASISGLACLGAAPSPHVMQIRSLGPVLACHANKPTPAALGPAGTPGAATSGSIAAARRTPAGPPAAVPQTAAGAAETLGVTAACPSIHSASSSDTAAPGAEAPSAPLKEDVFDGGLLDWLDDLPNASATLLDGCLDSGWILSDDIFDAAAAPGGGGGGAANVSAAGYDDLLMQAAVAPQPVPAAARAAAGSLESPFMMIDTATAAAGKNLYHPVLAKRPEMLPSQILQQQQEQTPASLQARTSSSPSVSA